MAIVYTPNQHTVGRYAEIFAQARGLVYPELDALEARLGYAIDRAWLDEAGRVLCCPIKNSPPHWQHGRLIYAVVREYVDKHPQIVTFTALDIGTAKGFSALCSRKAFFDAGVNCDLTSVDVMPPAARCYRNTVAELDGRGLKTLAEILAPFPASDITFLESTGIDWLQRHADRVHVAFVDGKHAGDVVRQEGKLLAKRQQPGDVVIFDDCQMPQVSPAVVSLGEWYQIEYVKAEPREYAVARRR
jgi:prepilin-type processing-associated H-X9-DG protein